MQRDPYSTAGLVLAVALVSAPFWLVPHAGDVSTTYAAERIDFASNGGIGASGEIRGVDCYADELTRGCLFARRIVTEGAVVVTPTELVVSSDSFDDAEYVAVGTDPPFRHRQIRSPEDAPERAIRYELAPVGAESVLRDVSRNRTAVPQSLRDVLDGETVTVHGRNFDVDGLVVRSEGTYYRIYVVERSEPTWDRNELLVLAVRGVPFVVGLTMLRLRWQAGA